MREWQPGWQVLPDRVEGNAVKMCPPGQGMPGRVYQIDAGWMGGAASTGYRGLPFGLSGSRVFALMFIGVENVPQGSKFF